jgi:MoaA/NifB/PqqE/SkfB family radical SAM enzyme
MMKDAEFYMDELKNFISWEVSKKISQNDGQISNDAITRPDTSIDIVNIQKTEQNQFHLNVEFRKIPDNCQVVIDIYPASDPRHPTRHYGHWSFFPQSNTFSTTFNINHIDRTVEADNLILSNKWIGEYFEDNEYTINVNLIKDGRLIKQAYVRQYFGRVYNIATVKERPEKLKSAVWFLTWKCNYKCSYCWEVQRILKGELKPEPYKDYKLWVNAWNKLKPEILDISGGEPFLQPNFIELINELDSSIKVAITSNLSFDIINFVENVSPDKIFSLTFSYHPTQKIDLEMFIGRILLVKNRGFGPITVNFVTWPEQMWLIEKYKRIFEKDVGVRFHVDPYAATPHFPYKFNDKELNYIRKFTESDRLHFFGETNNYNVACSGGVNHISVEPDGSAYRCIQDKVTGKKSLGNILDETFALNSKKTFCDEFFRCPGCDRDKVDIIKLDSPFIKPALI